VFLPYDAKIPKPAQQKLLSVVQSANKQGFKIRVALIWSDYDLGSVTALWRRPKTYARFLGVELSYYFKGRLLIVMPNGLGYNWVKHEAAPGYKLLAPIRVGAGPRGLAVAATAAVRKLASAAGVTLSTSEQTPAVTPSQRNDHDRVVIVVAVLVALLLGGAARLVIRRRAARSS
jgi:hypothetical protein